MGLYSLWAINSDKLMIMKRYLENKLSYLFEQYRKLSRKYIKNSLITFFKFSWYREIQKYNIFKYT